LIKFLGANSRYTFQSFHFFDKKQKGFPLLSGYGIPFQNKTTIFMINTEHVRDIIDRLGALRRYL
jgi:hypothetical protein